MNKDWTMNAQERDMKKKKIEHNRRMKARKYQLSGNSLLGIDSDVNTSELTNDVGFS